MGVTVKPSRPHNLKKKRKRTVGEKRRSESQQRHAERAARDRKAAQQYQAMQKKFNEELEEIPYD